MEFEQWNVRNVRNVNNAFFSILQHQTSQKASFFIMDDLEEMRVKYIIDVESNARVVTTTIYSPGPWYPTTTLQCWELNAPTPTWSMPDKWMWNNGKYQFDCGTKLTRTRYRPTAYRVPFILHPEFLNPEMTVSHLCHNPACYNPGHLVFELLAVNKGRNGCPGGAHCHHEVTCLRPGPYYNL